MQSVKFLQATKFQVIDSGYIIPCLQPIFWGENNYLETYFFTKLVALLNCVLNQQEW